MNIFKKIKLANRLLNLYTKIKNHFDKNTVTKEVKEKVENIINNVKDLINLIPDCTKEFNELLAIVKEVFKKEKK